jgi:hypothetical protein
MFFRTLESGATKENSVILGVIPHGQNILEPVKPYIVTAFLQRYKKINNTVSNSLDWPHSGAVVQYS